MESPFDFSRELLAGLLAVRTGLLDPEALAPALADWSHDRSRGLLDGLVARGTLVPAQRAAMTTLAASLSESQGAEEALRRLRLDGATLADLTLLNDPALDAVLDRIAPAAAAVAETSSDEATDPSAVDRAVSRARSQQSLARWRLAALAATVVAAACLLLLTNINRERFRLRAELSAEHQETRNLRADLDELYVRAEARVAAILDGQRALYDAMGRDFLLQQGEFFPVRTRLLNQARAMVDRLETIWGRSHGGEEPRALARAYEQLGDLQRRLGTPDDALIAHRRARWLRQSLVEGLEQPPRDLRRELGRSLLAVGELEVGTAVRKTATATLNAARALWSELALTRDADAPSDDDRLTLARCDLALARLSLLFAEPSETRQALGRAAFTLDAIESRSPAALLARIEGEALRATLDDQLGARHAALAALRAQVDLRAELSRLDPRALDNRAAMPALYATIGRTLDRLGQPRAAREALSESRTRAERLATDYPAITLFREQVAIAQGLRGAHHEQRDEPAEAVGAFEGAVATLAPLSITHPDVTRIQVDLAAADRDLGRALRKAGRHAEAGPLLQRARDRAVRRLDLEPSNPAVAREAAAALAELGEWLVAARRLDEAAGPIEHALSIRQALRRDHPDVKGYWQDLASSFRLLGLWHEDRDEPREAVAALAQAITNLEYVGLLEPELFYELAEDEARLVRLGRRPDSGLSAADIQLARDQAINSLLAAAQLGLRVPSRITANPLFDTIRAHERYPALLLDLVVPVDPFAPADPPTRP